MRNRLALLLSLSLLALSACSYRGWTDGKPADNELGPLAVKRINVDLVNGQVVVAEIVDTDITNGFIRWEVVGDAESAGCTFPRDGIKFDPNPSTLPANCQQGDPGRSFDDGKPVASGKRFQWKRKNFYEAGHCYKYTVTLVCTRASPRPHDPWVKNNV